MALASIAGAGSSSIGCAAGRIYTGYTGSVEGRCKLRYWGSSTTSFPLPSSVSIGEFFSHGQTAAPIAKDSNNPSVIQQNFLSALLVAAVDTAPLPWCHSATLSLDSLPLDEHVDC